MKKSRWRGCGVCLLVALVPMLALGLFLHEMRQLARRASGGNDSWELWCACVAYAKDHEGRFPPLDKEPGRLMVDRDIMHDGYGVTGRTVTMEYDETARFRRYEYEKDKHLAEDEDLIDDHSWWYLGYQVSNEDDVRAFVKAYIRHIVADNTVNPDLTEGGGDNKPSPLQFPPARLDEVSKLGHVEDETLSHIPVFIERPGHYEGYSGGWVHYLNGYRVYIDYPGRFPMTPRVIGMLRLLDDLGDIFKQPSE